MYEMRSIMRKKLLITAAAIILSAGSITGGTMAVYSAATHTDKTISTSSIGVRLNIADDGVTWLTAGRLQARGLFRRYQHRIQVESHSM